MFWHVKMKFYFNLKSSAPKQWLICQRRKIHNNIQKNQLNKNASTDYQVLYIVEGCNIIHGKLCRWKVDKIVEN